MAKKRIGLALSGGGVRASVYHLGVLRYLAERGLLERVEFISTVSGGSLIVGLIYSLNNNLWPSSSQLLDLYPALISRLTENNLQKRFTIKSLLSQRFLWLGRAKYLARYLEEEWGVRGCISTISDSPRWIINATCFETGKNWIFSKKRMGDYQLGYVLEPRFKIANCISASAAVPGLIGPLHVETERCSWVRFKKGKRDEFESTTPFFKKIKLWDGGVYDNLGLESLFKPGQEIRDGIDFLMVSDASLKPAFQSKAYSFKAPFFMAPFRLIDVATEQVRSLRVRMLMKYFLDSPQKGVLFPIGVTMDEIEIAAGGRVKLELPEKRLCREKARRVANFPTTLKSLSADEFELIEQHGYEVAGAVMGCYHPENF